MKRWNRVFTEQNVDFQLRLPHRAFNRVVGEFSEVRVDPNGSLVTEEECQLKKNHWLPSNNDLEYILSLMEQEVRPGKFANWIAPPRAGINGQTGDFEYVKLN